MASNTTDGNKIDASDYDTLAGDVMTYGSLCLALAMCQETGIIPMLCEANGPVTSEEVAQKCKLKERYVREVLNALAVSRLIELEEGGGGSDGQIARYLVPEDHRATLTQVAVCVCFVSDCARRFASLRNVFDLDGPSGFRYDSSSFEANEGFTTLNIDSFTEAILKTPGLQERFETGIDAIEIGSGHGTLILHLAAMFPKSRFTVTDAVPGPLDVARQRAQTKGLSNVTFRQLDLLDLPAELENAFDWALALEVIHDLPRPLAGLQTMFKLLRPGGQFSLFDQFVSSYVAENVGDKEAVPLYSMGPFLCLPESYQERDSEALGPCWGVQKARDLLQTAGFRVLGLNKSEVLGPLAVCMCEKPE